MLPEYLPRCVCKSKNWDSGGASINPFMTSQWFSCLSCKRCAVVISSGEAVILTPTLPLEHMTAEMLSYINEVLINSLQERQDRIQRKRDKLDEEFELLLRRWFNLPSNGGDREVLELADEQLALWRAMWSSFHKTPQYVQVYADEQTWIPPQLPSVLTAQVLIDVEGEQYLWQPVRHDESARLSLPINPVRQRHDQRFNRIFALLEEELGTPLTREEVSNQYNPSNTNAEPWYRFYLGDTTFFIGPRHRVVAIKIKAKEAFDVRDLRQQAKATDEVTYVNGEEWAGNRDTATEIEVHAWTDEKVVEYVTLVGRQFIPVPALP